MKILRYEGNKIRKTFVCTMMIACVLVCALFSSCNRNGKPDGGNSGGKTKYNSYSFDYFDTVTVITGYEKTEEEFNKVSAQILEKLSEYHKLYNIYLRYSDVKNICDINDLTNGEHKTVTVDKKIIDMLKFSKEMNLVTDGMVNVAMGSVLSLWHDYRTIGIDDPETASLPPMDRLLEAAKHTDINNLVIDEQNSTVTLTDPNMRLDVGAIAKGYAVEQIARWMEENNITNYILNVGGNVRAIGTKPDGTGWVIGIENPDKESSEYLAYLELDGHALVTSGSYQRYYVVDGKEYHHIIHPDTNMPSEGFVSVSVLCKDSGKADALSTALFCMPLSDGLALVESMEDVEALWLDDKGNKTMSSGWNKYIKK